MSIYTLRSFDSNNSLHNSQHQIIKIERNFIISNPQQSNNISLSNSFSQWNKNKLSNSLQKNNLVDLQNISQSIPSFSNFLQTFTNIKSNRSIEDDFIDNHLDCYYEALRVYVDSLDSQLNCYKKIKSFISSKLYTGMTYEPKKLQFLINQCNLLKKDQKQTLLLKFNKQKSMKQFFQKILCHEALQISYELLFCLKIIWSQYALNLQETFQAQLKQNCAIKAHKIVDQNWEALYYHQNIKFINMRKVSTDMTNSEELIKHFIKFLSKFTETIFFMLEGFFSHNLYETFNLTNNKQNILNYNKNSSKQIFHKTQLKRSFKSFKLISSSLDIVQSQQQEDQCLYRRKSRKKTKLQICQLSKNSSNTSMEFAF